jgi:type I restriction enzyme S subunit
VGDINHGRIDLNGMKRVNPEVLQRYHRTALQGGEVVISLVGAIGLGDFVAPATPDAKG